MKTKWELEILKTSTKPF